MTGPNRNPLSTMKGTKDLVAGFTPERGDRGRLFLVYGREEVTSLVLTLGALRLGEGEPIFLIDGDNSFDAYQISRAAQWARTSPEPLLKRMFVSRAFTCYQMEALVCEKLRKGLERSGARLVITLGLLSTFYDEAVSRKEAADLLRRVLAEIKRMTKEGYLVLAVEMPPPKPALARAGFLKNLWNAADAAIRAERDGRKLLLRQEKGVGGRKQWGIEPGTLLAGIIGEPENGPHAANIHGARSLRS